MELEENVVVADRFRLVRMIGRGGMGSVWQATHLSLDQPCAVKFIEGQLGNLAEAHARFEREAKAAAQLRSPHVVQILDHGVWHGRPYIAMELLEGEDLGHALAKAGGKLPPAQVAGIVQQVARALTKAHAAGIVHRDLKPDNIFLVNDDDRQLVKILDFGVAKHSSQAIEGSNTKTGAMLGTPYYMSPEQAQGIKSVDARSDLWSLAVIVFQCITGRLPFESEALGDLLVKIIVQPVPVPSSYGAVPVGFDRWWAKAAERNPDARFQTAKDFASELALAVGSTALTEPIAAPHALQSTALLQTGPQPQPAPTPQPQMAPPYATPQPYPPQPGALSSSGSVSYPVVPAPKRGVPVALVVGGLAIAAAGIGLAGYALTHKASATTGGSTEAPPPRVAASSAPLPSSASTAVVEPPPAVSSVATAEPPPTAKPVVHAPSKPSAPVPVVVKPVPSAAPSSSVKKWVPGF